MTRKTTSIRQRITAGLTGLFGKAAHPFYQIPLIDGGASGPKLEQPYAKSAWVFRAIQHVAGPISAVPVKWTERGEPVEAEQVFGGFDWRRPFAGGSGSPMKWQEAMEAVTAWLCLAGEACLVLDDSWLSRAARKSRPVLARPDSLKPVLSRDGELVGWRWRPSARRGEVLLIPEQVIRMMFYNPYDELRGLAPWQAAKIAADADYAAGVFAKTLGENNGDRGVYVVAKGAVSDPQREQIEAQLREKRRAARSGDFKIAFITGDVEVQDPKLQSVDAAFVAQRAANRQEVYIAFGVPPSFAEVTASYSIGSASDRYRLIEETCQPLANKIADGLEQLAKRLTGRELEAEFCWDEHSTMVQVRTERIESASRLWDRGIPWGTLDEYFDLDLPEFPGKRDAVRSFGLETVGQAEGDASDQVGPEPDAEDDPLDELRRLMLEPCKCGECQGSSGQVSSGEEKAKSAEEEKRAALWREHARKRDPWAKRFFSKASRLINDARVETLRRLEAQRTKGLEARMTETDVVFDLGEFMRDFLAGLGDVSQAAMRQAVAELGLEIGSPEPLELPPEKVLLMARRRGVFLTKTAADIWTDVAEEVRAGIQAGESIDEMATRLRGKFNMLSKERSTRIALTETTASYEMARQEGFLAAGVEWKEWLSSRDGRVRDAHMAADGQIVAADQPFVVEGVRMMHPGAYGAPAELVVNCRCLAIAVEEGPKA